MNIYYLIGGLLLLLALPILMTVYDDFSDVWEDDDNE